MYLMLCTRPDLAFAVGKLSKFRANPSTEHMQAAQRLLRYVSKTRNLGFISDLLHEAENLPPQYSVMRTGPATKKSEEILVQMYAQNLMRKQIPHEPQYPARVSNNRQSLYRQPKRSTRGLPKHLKRAYVYVDFWTRYQQLVEKANEKHQ